MEQRKQVNSILRGAHRAGHCRAFVTLYLGIIAVPSCFSETRQGSMEGSYSPQCFRWVRLLDSFSSTHLWDTNVFRILPSSSICVSKSNWFSSHILGYLGKRSCNISISVAGWPLFLERPWVLASLRVSREESWLSCICSGSQSIRSAFYQWSQWKQQELAGNKQDI